MGSHVQSASEQCPHQQTLSVSAVNGGEDEARAFSSRDFKMSPELSDKNTQKWQTDNGDLCLTGQNGENREFVVSRHLI